GEVSGGCSKGNFSLGKKPSEIGGDRCDFKLPISPEKWPDFWKHGEWNELRALITGNPPAITTWIKGVKFMEFKADKKHRPDKGPIALQVHGGGDWTEHFVRYRKIRVKELNKE